MLVKVQSTTETDNGVTCQRKTKLVTQEERKQHTN